MEKTPWHIWVVGVLALLWNAGGAWNYVATKLRLEAVVSQMTPQQLAFFESFPAWVVAAWAIAVWGGVLGAILILTRRALAAPVLAVSFAGMVISSVHNFLLADVSMADIMPPGAAYFSLAIFVFAALLVWYAYRQRSLGRLD